MKPRKIFPAVKRVGNAYAARRGRRPTRGPISRSLSCRLMRSFPLRQYRGAGGHACSFCDYEFPFGAQEYIDAGAKLDQADTFAFFYFVARALIKYDAACDQAC